MAELGKNVFIYSGTSGETALIAFAKSCTVSKSCELIEKASSTSATAREYVAGRTDWEITITHLVSATAPYDGLLKVGSSYSLSVVIGNTRKTGTAICTKAVITGAVGNLANGQVTFKGTGELT